MLFRSPYSPGPVSSTTAACSTQSVHSMRCWMRISRTNCADWRYKQQDGSMQKLRRCKQDKSRGSLTRPPASHTAPQSGSGTFGRGSFFPPWGRLGGLLSKKARCCPLFAGARRGYAQNLMRRKQRRSSTMKCTSVSNEKAVCNSSDFLLCL